MKTKNQQPVNNSNDETKGDNKLIGLILQFTRSDLNWLGRIPLKILRLKWHDRPIQTQMAPQGMFQQPTGPFKTIRKKHLGDLLLWVPYKIDSYLIDDMTGAYGYSHTTIDTGEIDIPTLKPVMAEITVGQTVSRKFQDQFGQRAYARVPLSKTGVNVKQFVECILAKLGEPYDDLDAISFGRIENPSKEVCSGLAADCLPEKERKRIAWAKRLGLLRRGSVSVHSLPNAEKVKEFVSPNGLAEYYGAPKGKKLSGPDITVKPHPIEISMESIATAATRRHGWKLALVVAAVVLVLFFLKRKGKLFF